MQTNAEDNEVNDVSLYARARGTLDQLLKGGTLRAKAMRGGAFLGGGSIAEQVVRFARNMILTRLLAPSAFGVMAIVLSSSAIVAAMTEIGQRNAVIQNPKGAEPRYLNAGWWIAMGRAMVTYAVIFAMAPFVAHFYGNAEISGLLRVALLGIVFEAAMSPGSFLVQKQMQFGRWMIISNIGGILGVIATVILSFVCVTYGHWPLAHAASMPSVFCCPTSWLPGCRVSSGIGRRSRICMTSRGKDLDCPS